MTKALSLKDFTINAYDLKKNKCKIFPTTISADIGLCGGIPEGVTVLLSGKPKVGKTTLALHYIQKCFQADPEKKAFFFDVESRLQPELLACFPGIVSEMGVAETEGREDRFQIIRSNETEILSAERYLEMILEALKDNPRCIVVLDSIAALCPQNELAADIGDSVQMATTPKLMYKLFRKISQILSVRKGTFIALTHTISNPGYGKNNMIVGGNATQYGASVWMEATHSELVYKNKEENEKPVGQNTHIRIYSTPLGPPGGKIMIPITFGKGIDETLDLANIAVQSGVINKGGSWFTVYDPENPGQELKKVQGANKLVDYLNENEDIRNAIDARVREILI